MAGPWTSQTTAVPVRSDLRGRPHRGDARLTQVPGPLMMGGMDAHLFSTFVQAQRAAGAGR